MPSDKTVIIQKQLTIMLYIHQKQSPFSGRTHIRTLGEEKLTYLQLFLGILLYPSLLFVLQSALI